MTSGVLLILCYYHLLYIHEVLLKCCSVLWSVVRMRKIIGAALVGENGGAR